MRYKEFQNLEQNKKLDEIYRSVERTRKYFMWTLIISILFIVLPLIALTFVIPKFLSIYDLGTLGL